MKPAMVLVTGATGKTGAALVKLLHEKGVPIRALVRRRDSRCEALAQHGVEVVAADLYDAEQMASALQGVQRAYYCPPLDPYTSMALAAFLYAADKNRLEVIVAMSQWLASPRHPTLMTRDMWAVEQAISQLRDTSVILNPGFFADNYFRVGIAMAAQLGMYANFVGESLNVPPSNEDMARVAAAVLMNPVPHAGRRYRVTGPKLVGVNDIVDSLSRVLKRSVRAINAPEWLLNKVAAYRGEPRYAMAVFRHYLVDHRQGAFSFGGPTDVVLRTTGSPAESLDETVRRYATRPEAQRNFGAFASIFAEFVASPMWRGYNHERYERRLDIPMLSHSLYAMQDERWKAERLAQDSGNRIVPLAAVRTA